MKNNQVSKLQVGCGSNFLTGWINSDWIKDPRLRKQDGLIYLNAKRRLPFEESSLNFIFSEHFLEHISLNEGQTFLKDCHRCLKANGVIRITTPDLEKLIDLYFDKNKYVRRQEYALKILQNPNLSPCILFDILMRSWGHKFIYNRALIKSILIGVGFVNVVFCESKLSNHSELCDLEMHGGAISWLDSAETMIVEATR